MAPRRVRSRIWFVRLESPVSRCLVLGVVCLAAGAAAWSVIKPGLADWVGRGARDVADLEWVVSWDPHNPVARTRAGRALIESVNSEEVARGRGHLEAALRMWPSHGFAWLRLAKAAERQGDRERARRAVAAALRLDPHNVALRWELATLLLQWGDREPAVQHLRYVLAVDPEQRPVTFQLLQHLAGPSGAVDTLLPGEPDALTNILQAGLHAGDVALTRAAWERRVKLAPPLPESLHRSYLHLLIEKGEGDAAQRAWSIVAPDGESTAPGSQIWNGGFEGEPLVGWGLGWRNARVWGVQVRVDRAAAARGSQSLRVSFNSVPNLEFRGVHQTVPVRPGQRYRLEALARAFDFTTRSGLKLQVVAVGDDRVIAETGAVSGTTSGWVPLTARVEVPPDVSLVRVRLCREKAELPEGNLGGSVWLDEVALVPLRGST